MVKTEVGEYIDSKVDVENASARRQLEETSVALEILSDLLMAYQNEMTPHNRKLLMEAYGRMLIEAMAFGKAVGIDPNGATHAFVAAKDGEL